MLRLTVLGRLPAGCAPAKVKRCVAAALAAADFSAANAALSVRVVDDEEMIRLNTVYRGKKKTTDVLSFSAAESPIPLPPDAQPEKGLGDIVISLPQVRRQAAAIGRPVIAEFGLMLVHGTLHLLGYDHATLREENEMFAIQHEAMSAAGLI